MKPKQQLSLSLLSLILMLSVCACEIPYFNQFLRKPVTAPSPSPSPGAESEFSSENARRAKANGEMLQEVYRVVFGTEITDRAEFGALVNALNQGASLEGMYNGFMSGERYRALVQGQGPANAATLKVFSAAMKDFVSPTKSAEELERSFAGRNFFELKKDLGEQAQLFLSDKKTDPIVYAAWYSAWAAGMAAKGVDFGIPRRNSADSEFHRQWAMEMIKSNQEDKILWEILNRLHRIMNASFNSQNNNPTKT